MPGIVGLITAMPRDQAVSQLLRMVRTLRHESFYETGTLVDESLGVYVGWSVQKNSFSDGMPLRNERGDVDLVFSGEEFPDLDTAPRLKGQGHVVEATQGSSYLIHLYEEDAAFPSGLNGRFHGLLIDRRHGTVSLFNDRYGMHRLFYHESEHSFYFAAEAKAILEVLPELRTADPRSVGEFICCGCVLENQTLFKNIHVLPPASAWVFDHFSIQRRNIYFQPREWEEQPPLDRETYYQELRDVFSRNLPRYFNGQQRIGVSLTGGLDTRMIMAWRKSPPGSLPCYSFGGMYRDSQDIVIARQVARACGQTHEVIRVGYDFLSRFPHYAERTVYLTDGCVDVSHSPDLYLNERATQIAPIRMTGNYGGEVLRRIRAFKPVETTPGVFGPGIHEHVNAARKKYASLIEGHPLSFAVFRQAPWHHYGLLALEQTQISLRSPFLDNDFVRTVFRAPEAACTSSDISIRMIAEGNPALAQIRTDRGLMTSNNGMRARATRALQSFTVKAEYAYDYGMPQWAARIDRCFSPFHFERLFLGRHKFYHFRVWYRDALSQYVQEMLLDSRTLSRPYLERKMVEAIVTGHLRGDCNYTSEIHKLLTLELISRIFLDAK